MPRASAQGSVPRRLVLTLLLFIALAVPAAASGQEEDRLRTYRDAAVLYRSGLIDEALGIARSWKAREVNGDAGRITRDRDERLAPAVALLLTELARKDSMATNEHFSVAETLVNGFQRLSPAMKEFRERWYAFRISALIAELVPSAARTLIDRALRVVGESSRLQLLSGIAFEVSTYPHATCAGDSCRASNDERALARGLTRAASAYQQAIALEPQSFDAHLRLGRALHLVGDRDGARREFAEVEQLTSRRDLRYLVALFRADLHQAEGDLRTAADEAERALRLGPDYQSARIALAYLNDQLGMVDRSRQIVDELLRLPKVGDPWWEFRQPAEDTDSLDWMRALIRE